MKVSIYGCGSMGAAIAESLKSQAFSFTFYRGRAEQLKLQLGGIVAANPSEAVKNQDVLFLCFKPYNIQEAAREIQPFLSENTLIISILAGVTIETIQGYFPDNAVYRVMPNLPIAVQKGVVAISRGQKSSAHQDACVNKLLEPLGAICHIEESMMDGFTALFSSGVAFVLSFLESMEIAGEKIGFSREMSEKFLQDLFTGSFELIKHQRSNAHEMIKKVSSPNGTTVAGLHKMRELGVQEGIVEGVMEALKRSQEISKMHEP